MARMRKRRLRRQTKYTKRSAIAARQRDALRLQYPIASRPLTSRLLAVVPQEDRRRYRPSPIVPKQVTGRPTRIIVPSKLTQLAFAAPKKVTHCVRRSRRREVIHALNLTGKGARAHRRRRNQWSTVRC